jgi:hypothetical protein
MTIRGRSTAHTKTGWRVVSLTTRGAEDEVTVPESRYADDESPAGLVLGSLEARAAEQARSTSSVPAQAVGGGRLLPERAMRPHGAVASGDASR